MSRRAQSRSAIGVGLSTLVTIMVAVLLTTFSVLTLVSARADLRLSNKVIASTQGYYAADGDAEQWLAGVDALVQEGHGDLAGALSAAGYEVATTGDGRTGLSAVFPMDSGRDLMVEIALDRTGEIDILRWQSVPKRPEG
ncbi:MAG: hypothetical protein LBP24_03140 [Coriobacteriales bacterium]|nr:hypothetical protein [Coriobacteriales bacterium]